MSNGEFPDTAEEVSGQRRGGRPRKWGSDAERKAAKRQADQDFLEQARSDEEYVQRELEITRQRYAGDSALDARLERSEQYLRRELAGEIGHRSS